MSGPPAADAALPPGWAWQPVCASEALVEGGDGVRFAWRGPAGEAPAFVVRYDARPVAFVNRCAHVAVELDWLPGKFFDSTGLYLICATHGALYDPADGRCAGGPCAGRSLERIDCREHDATVWVAMNHEER